MRVHSPLSYEDPDVAHLPLFQTLSTLPLPPLYIGSEVMTISFNKGLTRNRKYSYLRLGQVKNTKFGTNVSNKMLLDTAKCQGYSF